MTQNSFFDVFFLVLAPKNDEKKTKSELKRTTAYTSDASCYREHIPGLANNASTLDSVNDFNIVVSGFTWSFPILQSSLL